jgi:hypothetical protein
LQGSTKIRRNGRKARFVGLIFKSGFAALFAGLLYRHIHTMPVSGNWTNLLTADRFETAGIWLLFAVALMPVNWALETLKWQGLMRVYGPLRFGRAFAAVLSGVTISLFTPNRIGEYGGRLLALAARLAWGAVISSLLGTWIQWAVLLAGGVAGMYHLALKRELTDPGQAALFGTSGNGAGGGCHAGTFSNSGIGRIGAAAFKRQVETEAVEQVVATSALLRAQHWPGPVVGRIALCSLLHTVLPDAAFFWHTPSR